MGTTRSTRRAAAVAGFTGGLLALSLAGAGPVASVTFGSEVVNPQNSKPWAVAIHILDDEGDLDPASARAICTGTALDRYTVLTAAHCVEDGELFAVGYGGARLGTQTLEPVAAIISHPSYGSSAIVNDVAVVRTLDPMDISVFPRIATKSEARKARKKGTKLSIYGWGTNQNGVQTGRLQTASLKPQTAAAKKYYRSSFIGSRTLAAGRYIKSTRTYAAGCYGRQWRPTGHDRQEAASGGGSDLLRVGQGLQREGADRVHLHGRLQRLDQVLDLPAARRGRPAEHGPALLLQGTLSDRDPKCRKPPGLRSG